MADSTIACPFCSHEVRLPEVLLGKPVRCPRCYSMFRAPQRTADGELGAAEMLPANEEPVVAPTSGRDRVRVPAGMLMFLAILSLFFTGSTLWIQYTQPEVFREQAKQNYEMTAKWLNQPIQMERMEEHIRVLTLTTRVCFGFAVLTLIGMLCALTRKAYFLAIVGCGTACLNLFSGCCVPSIPIAIWLVIVLNNPNVRRSFGS